jgi:site-specific DNA-adenine methylase
MFGKYKEIRKRFELLKEDLRYMEEDYTEKISYLNKRAENFEKKLQELCQHEAFDYVVITSATYYSKKCRVCGKHFTITKEQYETQIKEQQIKDLEEELREVKGVEAK